ncbi:hypothetical protein [Hyphococcus sp.]|uniref:hypothetical protein n=1 Tax=Hyphococcus sp. TaxID=2038636 RepID=UPI003CCBE62F
MGFRIRKLAGSSLTTRLWQGVAISPFTIFLLGFGFIYWIMLMFTTVITVECEYAIIWVSGWFNFASLYQWSVVAIGLCAATWLARVLFVKRLNCTETIAQFVFILALAAVAMAQKAYLFPYGAPSRLQVEKIVQSVWRNNLLLIEEQEILTDFREGWKYDYPPPPFASSPEHPSWDETINLRLPQIFKSRNSPTWKEYQSMFTCFADYQLAVTDYYQNMKIWNEYWAEFNDWYARNRWRYDDVYPRFPYWQGQY